MREFVFNSYRFILSADSTPATLHWNHILQVIVPTISPLDSFNEHASPTTCPICLDALIAPRMLLCGHIFCLPCLLQHLASSDNPKYTKCAVCGDVFYLKQVKPVHLQPILPSSSTIDLTLLRKPLHSQLALPTGHLYPSSLVRPQDMPPSFIPDVFTFAKTMHATPSTVSQLYTRDIHALQRARDRSAGDTFTQMYMDDASARVVDALHAATNATPSSAHQHESHQQVLHTQLTHRPPYTPSAHTPDYFFYQSSQGLPVFLHTLDSRMLLQHYGAYAAFPPHVTLRVEHTHECIVDAHLQRRCKYLAHLPLGCEIIFVETSLEGVVDDATLDAFKEPLLQRRRRRMAKQRKEDQESRRARRRADVEESERVARQTEALSASSFPQMLSTRSAQEEDEESQLNHALAISSAAASSSAASPWGGSFATALSCSDTNGSQRREDIESFDLQWNRALEEQNSHSHENVSGSATSSAGAGKKKKKKTLVLGAQGSRRA
ncbi:hypothetical protein E3P86_02797 [Wallemia ichthyophaga]|uniref:RING-type domain-containing protein n=1 Tax=Wallemia ichthyophaga TaxID=245174 RepID=A0A4T0IXG6_WALIC|nr:hypothetical protein E3P86_02797 [Wallemia ichthyophaga]